ncbi:TRAP transporter small permease [Minwuia thermotolerans]|uniref:TRAP transporter small permease protein n=1 Tax=Minwuia thermotolerans TaxID=2056226 RepID=A0A2M9FVJ9_9PROT|nr:TRAP transporter small permease [Minwuia thermotolerans]PJK27495.1 TRAP transporter small permease [Minwuia thermotolerans]
MSFIDRWLARATNLTTVIGAIAVVLMMVHITVDVVGKFILFLPVPATITLVSNYYMVVVAFLPLALAERRNSHISVEVLTEQFSPGVQRHIHGWTCLYSAVIFSLLTYRSFLDAVDKYELGSFIMEQSTKVPIWPGHFLLPLGAGLMVLMLLLRFANYLSGRPQPGGSGTVAE